MRLLSKLRRLFTLERILWCFATLLLAGVFLLIGLTAPSIKGFERKENSVFVHQESSTDSISESASEAIVDENYTDKVPLNSATKEQLMSINGIGESFAQRIIDYREENGDFTDLEQLKNIDGIGEKRYEKWSPYFTLD